LGAALARRYALKGCRLSLFGRDAKRLEETAIACREDAAEVMIYRCDLRDADETARCLAAADGHASVDLLIANAGVGGALALAGPDGETRAQAQILVETNFLSVLNTVVPLATKMALRGTGHIVMMGSIAGLLALPQSPVYCATKSAIHAYGDGLRRLMRRSGVTVTVVCPGFVETPMSAQLSTAKPFLWTADDAASHIVAAIDKKRKRVIFPWQLAWAVAAARLAPFSLVDYVLSRA
jgi:short-subunit dehydrogenase